MLQTIVARAGRNRAAITAEVMQNNGATQAEPGRPSVRYQAPYSPAVAVVVPPSISPFGGSAQGSRTVGDAAAAYNIVENSYSRPPDMTLVMPDVYMTGGLDTQAGAPVRIIPMRGGQN